jgi:hypothetical protein
MNITLNHGGDMLLIATLLFACGEKTEETGDAGDTGDTARLEQSQEAPENQSERS